MRAAVGDSPSAIAEGVPVLECDARLAEEAVLRRFAALGRAAERGFRQERDRIYALDDLARREAAFHALHVRWFAALDLDLPVRRALTEQPGVGVRVDRALMLPAFARREQMADLVFFDSDREPARSAEGRKRPVLVIRLAPESFLEPGTLLALLRHELLHVADMLDPDFGYQRTLLPTSRGPSSDQLLRDRYRVVWDVTINGRLAKRGWANPSARDEQCREFVRAFPTRAADFERWFDGATPTHAEIVAYIGSGLEPGRDAPSSRGAAGG